MTAHEAKPLSPVHDGVGALRQEFSDQAKYWDERNELPMAAMFEALYEESLDNPEVDKVLEDILVTRGLSIEDMSTSAIAGTVRVTLFEDLILAGQNPDELTHPSQWRGPIKDLAELVNNDRPPADRAERYGRLLVSLVADLVCTSPYTRANPDELAMQALRERFPDGVRWLDIGTGMVTTPNQVLQKEDFPMHVNGMFLLRPKGNGHMEPVPSPELLAAGQELLAAPHRVTHCLATDLIDPYRNAFAQQRALASLRSSERTDEEYMETYHGLNVGAHDLLSFEAVDFASPEAVAALREKLNGQKFNFITISTVQHQLSRPQRRAMDANAQLLLEPGGIIFKKDFAHYSPSRGLEFYQQWHEPWKYRGFIYDPQLPDLGWQEFCRTGDSRCLDIAMSTGKVAVGRALYESSELVLRRGDINRTKSVSIDLGVPPPRHSTSP